MAAGHYPQLRGVNLRGHSYNQRGAIRRQQSLSGCSLWRCLRGLISNWSDTKQPLTVVWCFVMACHYNGGFCPQFWGWDFSRIHFVKPLEAILEAIPGWQSQLLLRRKHGSNDNCLFRVRGLSKLNFQHVSLAGRQRYMRLHDHYGGCSLLDCWTLSLHTVTGIKRGGQNDQLTAGLFEL